MRILTTLCLLLFSAALVAQVPTVSFPYNLDVQNGTIRLADLNRGNGKIVIDSSGGRLNFWTPQDRVTSFQQGDTTFIVYQRLMNGFSGVVGRDTVFVVSATAAFNLTALNGLTYGNDTIVLGGNLTRNTTITNNGFKLVNQIDSNWTLQTDPDLTGAGRGGFQVQYSTSGGSSLQHGVAEFAAGVRYLSRYIDAGDTVVMEVRDQKYTNNAFRNTRRQVRSRVDSNVIDMRFFQRSPDDSASVISIGRTPVQSTLFGPGDVNHIRISAASRTAGVESQMLVLADSIVMISDQGGATDPFVLDLNSGRGYYQLSGGDLTYHQTRDSVFYQGIRDVSVDTTNFKPAVFNTTTDELVRMSSWVDYANLNSDSFYGAQTDTSITLIMRVGGVRNDSVLVTTDPSFNLLSIAVDTSYAQLFSYVVMDVSSAAGVVVPPAPVGASFEPGDWFGVIDAYSNAASNNITVAFNGASQKLYNSQADDVLSTDGATVLYIFADNTTGWAKQE